MKFLNKIFSSGIFASILAANYISPVKANRSNLVCFFIHQVGDYPENPITECRDEGNFARYIAYNNYGITEEDFNTMVNNVMKDKIKTLNYTLTSSVSKPNPYNYFPESINQINLDELELNCHNDFSTEPYTESLGNCVIHDNVLQSPTMKRLTLRHISLTQNNMIEIGNMTTLEKLSFYDNEFSNVSFKYLKSLTKLSDLTYGFSSLTVLPRGALNRKYFQDVKSLTLSGIQFSDINIKEINALYALEKFTVKDAYFSEELNKFYFLNKTSLNEVILDFNENQEENAFKEISIKLPESTKKLYIKGVKVTNVLLKQINNYDPYLEELHLNDDFYEESLDFKKLYSLKQLTKLTLENNHVTEIKNLRYLKNLKSLTLSFFDITEDLIYNISKLTQLEELIISNCGYLNDPNNNSPEYRSSKKPVDFSSLKKLVNLKIIQFTFNKFEFTKINDKIYYMPNLKELFIYDNKFSLSNKISKLTNLENLTLFECGLTEIPEEIGSLINLKQFIIELNQVKSLPDSITQLTNLELLYLGHNEISELPEDFGNLKSLGTLDIRYNSLRSLPDSFGNLKNLTSFDARYNSLSALPESFGNLDKLEVLNVGVNNLEEIPEYIENFKNLKQLTFTNNKLLKIPDEVFKLQSLEGLYLNKNNITRIPDKFDNMVDLKDLDLSENIITDKLPSSLNKLSKLRSVLFYDNTFIKGDVLTNPNLKICKYCSRYQNNCASKECYDEDDLPISTDGRCGKGHARCPLGICCSKDGYCDSTYDQCFMSNGCQPKYGTCKKPCMICELDLTQNDFEFNEKALPTSHNGRCGKEFGTKCPWDLCCTKDGYCLGSFSDCDTDNGCQGDYGVCIYHSRPALVESN